jgi:hypothetical protein
MDKKLASQYPKSCRHGLESEDEVIEYFERAGHAVHRSTRTEDMRMDIDIYVDGVPFSLKSQPQALKYGTFILSLVRTDAATGKDVPGWFHRSKAEVYCFRVGNLLHIIHRDDLDRYCEEVGFKTTQPSKKHKIRQLQSKQRQYDKLLARIDIHTLVDEYDMVIEDMIPGVDCEQECGQQGTEL